MDQGRNRYIDLLRAAAILPVLLGHWGDSALAAPGPSLIGRGFSQAGSLALDGVLLFFVISGFVITRAAMARQADLFRLSYRKFYPRRFARIYPLLIAAYLIGIAALELSRSASPLRDFVVRNPAAVFDAAFWGALGSFTFNIWRIVNQHVAPGWGLHWDVMWSLAVEEQFYIAFPLLIFLSKTRTRLVMILWAIILLSAGYRLAYRWDHSPYNSLVCFELIAAGVLAAVSMPRIPSSRMLPAGALGGILLGAGFLMPSGTLLSLFRQEFIATGACLLLCCAVSAPPSRSRLILPIAFIGELSYGIYLLHPMVLYLIGGTIRVLGYIPGYFVFVAATTLIAALSYRYYEEPAGRLIRDALAGPAARPAKAPTI